MVKRRIKEVLSAEWYAFRLLFSVSVPSGILYIVLRALSHPVGLINTVIWKYVIDEFAVVYSSGDISTRVWVLLCTYLGINLLSGLATSYALRVLGEDIHIKAQNKLDQRIMRKVASLDSSFFDDPKNRDMLETARYSKDRVISTITYMVIEVVYVITFIAGLILFIRIDPIVSTVYLLTAVPGMIINYKYDVKMNRHSINSIPETRRKDYYRSLLTGNYAAKDVRLYDLSAFLKQRYNDSWNHIRRERMGIFSKGTKYSFISEIFTMAGNTFLVSFTVYSILKGNMSLGTLSMFLSLKAKTLSQFLTLMRSITNHFKNEIPHIQCFRDFLEHYASSDERSTDDTDDIDMPDMEGAPEIEFCDVCFCYPGSSVNVIDHLDLKIPSGKKIALIGVNGAGKSTMIKLLLRFYEPQSGNILVNGRDIRRYPLDRLYRLFGICFQNVTPYSLTVRENIALSSLDMMDDDEKLHRAALEAGIYGKYSAFSDGIDSHLTRQFDDKGYELSGGEWQKVGIARAFFRGAPFIILDEPSSALDAQAEDELFSSFDLLCKDKGGILISHRMSAMMMVDEIALLKDGRIAERGTHEQLLQNNGEYAKLYRMQAENYVSKGGN